MSKKNRQRRVATKTTEAAAADTAADHGKLDAFLDTLLSRAWTAIASGDPLDAEVYTSGCMAVPRTLAGAEPRQANEFVAKVIVNAAQKKQSPEGAAMLRLLMSLGAPSVKRAASRALAEMTAAGIYPLDWVNEAGKPVPVKAWRRYDGFGDEEAIAMTFRYGEKEHGIAVDIDLVGVPTATTVAVYPDAAILTATMDLDDAPFARIEEISLAEARRRLEGPLAETAVDHTPGIDPDDITHLPIARSRVRRLPAEEAPPAPPATATAADRASAVDDFMKSEEAAEAVAADEAATRFWAEVLTGYSSRLRPAEPPAQVGPRKLATILLGHVPATFDLSPAQRRHLEPAVTAWAKWSAAHRGLDEATAVHIAEDLPDAFARFDEMYDDPGTAGSRAYVTDLSASDSDIAWLAENADRRMFAMPMPGFRENGEWADDLDGADPAGRLAYAAAEFANCNLPEGTSREEFVRAVQRVVEQLWQGEPLAVWERAQRMAAQGHSRHDIIHTLVDLNPGRD